MYKKIILTLSMIMFSLTLQAQEIDGEDLAMDLDINPKSKVMTQWNKVFQNKRKMKRYGIDTLSKEEQKVLKNYLINNAKDSDTAEGCVSDI